MKKRIFFAVLFIGFQWASALWAQEFFVCSNNGNIGVVNIGNCSYRNIPQSPSGSLSFPDITFHPNGKLYGYSGGTIYEVDTSASRMHKVIAHSDSVKASSLTADAKGIIYGAYNQLWSFDVATNQFKILGNIIADGQQVTSGGDLTFYNGELYLATDNNKLVKVNISDPTQSSVYMTFSSSEVVIGIVSFKDCITKTFAITDGSRASILEIDWKNRTTKFLCTLPTGVYGAASRFEFLASKPDTTVIEQYTCDTNQVKSVTQVFKNSLNCDSSVTTKTIYLGSKPTITTFATCNFNDAKSDTTRFKNAKGCDSLVIKMGVFNEKITVLSQTICFGDSLYFGNKYYKSEGSYFQSYPRPLQCDSVVNLKISYKTRPSQTTNSWVCESSKVKMDTINTSALGVCDSIFIRNYRLAPRSQDVKSFDKTVCFNENFNWNDKVFDKTGNYKAVFKNEYNCDSTVTLNLTVLNKDSIFQEKQTCNSQQAGIKREVFKNKRGCDSIVVTNYKLKTQIEFKQVRSLCDGMSLIVGDTTYKTTGIYVKKLRNTEGCDSVVTTDLRITTIDLTMPNDTILSMGDSVLLQGTSRTNLPIKWQWTPSTFLNCDTCNTTWAKPTITTTYRLAIYDTLSKCRKEGVVNIRATTDCPTFVPTAFSPNNDGVNDVLKIYLSKCVQRVKRFAVFNRWGNALVQVNNISNVIDREIDIWNGIIDGKVVMTGVYAYFVEVEYINGQSEILKGDFSVVQ